MTKSISEIKIEGRTALVISDVHANLPALTASLASRRDGEPIICAGDIVGYYAEPNECCDLIKASGVVTIRGNHDAYVIGALRPKAENRRKYRTDWTIENLRPDNLGWLRSLPQTVRIEAKGITITLRHANPVDEETYLYPDTDLTPYAQEAGTLLIVGHTHHPMLRIAGAGRILNPGSVGQPRDRNPQAACARVDLVTGEVNFLRVEYDVFGYQERLRAMGWPEETIAILSRV
ncbi:metallophosphoesterase family protein [Nitratireductor aquimarinus]|uniref:metallophosphoesterase family protein n=1 Tax=Nitratireductor TaxID=245876 RepID=UPI0019D3D00C|nr:MULTISPECIES: metallophosphoesterase family protein [Nitratireductor]MBN7777448.1 metallophosphoesterase family protein [Nitratireductor pacificus]MBN7781441.1 metallophosphoesterase family protein [Nitratireductor pacificus]MBN7790247.1 metallophosphoesterase family protein [Nitratireductor aquimarinus]MBY6099657.1 metallophosphatase family protein [Nitratireductor aquimarinus]MCA1261760.1 metallophosphatase family protein [Nitratireductor aquimarinus]